MFLIPSDRLPPGFAERIERPPADPPEPVPAATTVLLREGADGLEVLLLRRHRRSGFVPGAYVFPGGRVDAEDSDPRLLERTDRSNRATHLAEGTPVVSGAAHELSSAATAVPNPETGPTPDYRLAALRELFEETGVLLALDANRHAVPDATSDTRLSVWRAALLEGSATLFDVVEALDLRLATAGLVYCAHWITPVAERRRYDTRFFLAALPSGAEVRIDAREMTDALWLTPAAALERFHAGRLPMVFPTLRTLEALQGFRSADAVLSAYRRRAVTSVLPRLVRTPEGVGIVVDGAGA